MNTSLEQLAKECNWCLPGSLPSDWSNEDYVVSPDQMKAFANRLTNDLTPEKVIDKLKPIVDMLTIYQKYLKNQKREKEAVEISSYINRTNQMIDSFIKNQKLEDLFLYCDTTQSIFSFIHNCLLRFDLYEWEVVFIEPCIKALKQLSKEVGDQYEEVKETKSYSVGVVINQNLS